MHVAAGGILLGPYALMSLLRDGVEGPQQLAGTRVIRLEEAADAVLAAVGADQHLVLHHGRRHRLAVALLGIGDLRLPDALAGVRVERDQPRVHRTPEELAARDRSAGKSIWETQ